MVSKSATVITQNSWPWRPSRPGFSCGLGSLRGRYSFSGEEQLDRVAGTGGISVEEHVDAGSVAETEAVCFGDGDDALEIFAANHQVDVACQRRVG